MRRSANVKMKVKVSKLRAAIVHFVEQDKKRHAREMEQFERAAVKAREQYVENVAAYLADLRAGKDRRESYNVSNYLERGCKFPKEPKEPTEYKELLVKLDLAEDQILTVDDHSDYMRFLGGKWRL